MQATRRICTVDNSVRGASCVDYRLILTSVLEWEWVYHATQTGSRWKALPGKSPSVKHPVPIDTALRSSLIPVSYLFQQLSRRERSPENRFAIITAVKPDSKVKIVVSYRTQGGHLKTRKWNCHRRTEVSTPKKKYIYIFFKYCSSKCGLRP